ncbi:hypothetical protein LguiA_002818 [Lonicera macranthoides]
MKSGDGSSFFDITKRWNGITIYGKLLNEFGFRLHMEHSLLSSLVVGSKFINGAL